MGRLQAWAQAFVWGNPTETLLLLKELSAGVWTQIGYYSRETEGTQTPTLDRGLGSCRDLAVLFAEAVRMLGFGARTCPSKCGWCLEIGRELLAIEEYTLGTCPRLDRLNYMEPHQRELYTSSNGDSWYLQAHNGEAVVLHKPNSSSGGRPSEIPLHAFLVPGNRSPEHQALRKLISALATASQGDSTAAIVFWNA
jgi:hypothetical protein